MRLLFILAGTAINAAVFSQATTNVNYFDEGMRALDGKNYVLATDHFKKALQQKPQYGEAWYQLGCCYNMLEKYPEAIKALKNAKIWWKDEAKVYYESGYANDLGGRINNAIRDYKKCIELDKTIAGPYRQLGNIFFDIDHDYKSALDHYNHFITYAGERNVKPTTWYKKGFSEIELELYENAVVSLQKSIDRDNKHVAAYNDLGYAYYQLNRADDAIRAYQLSRHLDSVNSVACGGLGDTYRYLKQNTDTAFKYYLLGAQINPNSQLCNYGTGRCYNEKGMHSAAIPYLKKTIELNKNYTAAYTELGYAYYALQQYDEALLELDKSLQVKETSFAYYYKALCYIAKHQKNEAQLMYQKLLDLKSPDASGVLKKINAL